MKNFIFFIFFTLIMLTTSAQIVIDQSDMVAQNDTFRISITTLIPVDFTQTGRDTTWNFSMLEPVTQRVDTFLNATEAPLVLKLVFIPGSVANLATPHPAGLFIPGFSVSDYYTFYKSSSSAFSDVGFGFLIEGIPVPLRYNAPDNYYIFPLDTATIWSSHSVSNLNIPELFYFSTARNRNSFVDGWGQLITPFGTFETIRVRSDLIQHDSIFIDSLGIGIGFNQNITEYKWLAKGSGIPILQITHDGLLATAEYQDSARMSALPFSVDLGPDTTVNKGATVTLTAHASGGAQPYQYFWMPLDTGRTIIATIDSTTLFSVIVLDALNNFSTDQKLVKVISPGIDEYHPRLLTIFPNPCSGLITVRIPENAQSSTLEIIDALGRIVERVEISTKLEHDVQVNLSTFTEGLYHAGLVVGKQYYSASVLIKK